MLKKIILLLALTALTLAACQGSATQTQAGATAAPTVVATSKAAIPTRDTTASTMACTVVSTEPEQQSPIPAVSDQEWIKGPETAAITIIEYSDFQ